MLTYRHGFHAGNWADVHKHSALALLLLHLRSKANPFCVLDVFAGDGSYDLAALNKPEVKESIAGIWCRRDAPPGVNWYLERVRPLNPDGRMAHYPGSPMLARDALRRQDRLILAELHPDAWQNLKARVKGDRRIVTYRRDGLDLLTSLLPPPIVGGMVLVDPAYEMTEEFDRLPAILSGAIRQWGEGIFAVWYPVLPAGRHAMMMEAMTGLPARNGIFLAEISPPAPAERGMQAAGMIIFNPPGHFAEAISEAGEWLAAALWPEQAGRHQVDWLRRAAE